mmetsp:Transcript_13996/g.30161  ORF Transcript_13996/g.30161 Transcript_13996/m.30161 type:complete len:265 (+) Transcript_13996:938-1732(+)
MSSSNVLVEFALILFLIPKLFGTNTFEIDAFDFGTAPLFRFAFFALDKALLFFSNSFAFAKSLFFLANSFAFANSLLFFANAFAFDKSLFFFATSFAFISSSNVHVDDSSVVTFSIKSSTTLFLELVLGLRPIFDVNNCNAAASFSNVETLSSLSLLFDTIASIVAISLGDDGNSSNASARWRWSASKVVSEISSSTYPVSSLPSYFPSPAVVICNGSGLLLTSEVAARRASRSNVVSLRTLPSIVRSSSSASLLPPSVKTWVG